MLEALLAVLLGAVFAVALTYVDSVWNRRSWLQRKTKRRILVQTTDGKSIEGVLWHSGRDGLVLITAALLDGEGRITLSGETFVARTRVLFLQVLPESSAT